MNRNWTIKQFAFALKEKWKVPIYITFHHLKAPCLIEAFTDEKWGLIDEAFQLEQNETDFLKLLLSHIYFENFYAKTSILSLFQSFSNYKLEFLPLYKFETLEKKLNSAEELAEGVVQAYIQFKEWEATFLKSGYYKWRDLFAKAIYPILKDLTPKHPIFLIPPKKILSKLKRYMQIIKPFVETKTQLLIIFEQTFIDYVLSKLTTSQLKAAVKLITF